jgi:GTPase SAR1 family protein
LTELKIEISLALFFNFNIDMNLTKHQNEIMLQVIGALKTYNRIVLQGSAGVGKTFLVNELLKNIRIISPNLVYLCAPTNKALAVLKNKTTYTQGVVFSTVHNALKLKRKFNKDTGEIYFEQEYSKKYPPFNRCQLAIIDESSMLNEELLKHLEQYRFPIIFIGDEKQLNPVKEVASPVFHKHWKTFTLTEIIRQGEGNPIINLSRDLEKIWSKEESLVDGMGYVYTSKRDKIIEELSEANGTDSLKYLAWTNAEVDVMNYSVRHNIYNNPSMLEKNEVLIFNAPYGDNFYTNQELKVVDLTIEYHKFTPLDSVVTLKVYVINDTIRVVHEDSIKQYKGIMKILKGKCINGKMGWTNYFSFIEQFADFKYNHAITVHKSQGSTYTDVILNVRNLTLNRNKEERQRLLYTGITRASNLLILYNV